ncbi:MAG: YlbF family regulator [Fusobacteria bacterium]|nr:YlbF family regulator [Fusobacteriota bacterium]
MSIIEKKNELIDEIKNSIEYIEFIEANDNLKKYPEQKISLDEYKKLLIENQLGMFLGQDLNEDESEKIDQIYEEISQYEAVNNFLNAEYKLKNVLQKIYQDLNYIIENKESKDTN